MPSNSSGSTPCMRCNSSLHCTASVPTSHSHRPTWASASHSLNRCSTSASAACASRVSVSSWATPTAPMILADVSTTGDTDSAIGTGIPSLRRISVTDPIHAFTGGDALLDRFQIGAKMRRGERCECLADDLVLGVAEDPFGAVVPLTMQSVGILAEQSECPQIGEKRRRTVDALDRIPHRSRTISHPYRRLAAERRAYCPRRCRFGESVAVASRCRSLADFATGATMWCVAPAVARTRPARRGRVRASGPRRQARPAGGQHRVRDPVAALRSLVRSGDVVLAVSTNDSPDDVEIMRRAEAWGVTTIWVGAGAATRRAIGRSHRVGRRRCCRRDEPAARRSAGAAVPRAVGADPRVLRAPRSAARRPTTAVTTARSASRAPTRAESARSSPPSDSAERACARPRESSWSTPRSSRRLARRSRADPCRYGDRRRSRERGDQLPLPVHRVGRA